MTYEDIIDWADERFPDELYEEFEEEDYIADITIEFGRHKHYLPPEAVDELRENFRANHEDDEEDDEGQAP